MSKEKKVLAMGIIILGFVLICLGILQIIPLKIAIVFGAPLLGNGVFNFIFEFIFNKSRRVKIIDEDERNLQVKGKAYTIAFDFMIAVWIIAIVYEYIYREDILGTIIFIILFLATEVIYAISFHHYNKIH